MSVTYSTYSSVNNDRRGREMAMSWKQASPPTAPLYPLTYFDLFSVAILFIRIPRQISSFCRRPSLPTNFYCCIFDVFSSTVPRSWNNQTRNNYWAGWNRCPKNRFQKTETTLNLEKTECWFFFFSIFFICFFILFFITVKNLKGITISCLLITILIMYCI